MMYIFIKNRSNISDLFDFERNSIAFLDIVARVLKNESRGLCTRISFLHIPNSVVLKLFSTDLISGCCEASISLRQNTLHPDEKRSFIFKLKTSRRRIGIVLNVKILRGYVNTSDSIQGG